MNGVISKDEATVLSQPPFLTGEMFVKLSLTVGPCLDPTASGTGCARTILLDLFDVFCAAWQQKSLVVIFTRCYT